MRLLPSQTLDGLTPLHERYGVEHLQCLVAACVVLVHRCSAQGQVVIGLADAERGPTARSGFSEGVARLSIWPFDVSDDPTVGQLMNKIRETVSGGVARKPPSASDVTRGPMLAPGARPTSTISVLVEVRGKPILFGEAAESREPQSSNEGGGVEFDVCFTLAPTDQGWFVGVEYLRQGWSSIPEQSLLALYQVVLDHMPANADRKISVLPLLSEDERKKVVIEWNQTDADYPAKIPLHRLIEAQAARTPRRVAVAFEGNHWCYDDLDSKANQLAIALLQQGVGRGDFVGVWLDRSLDQPLCLLAIMKTGAAFIPIDVNWPIERVAGIVRDSGMKLVLIDTGRLAPSGFGVPCIPVDGSELAGASDSPALEVDPDDPLYVIYTSGSTGKPKGVINRHRGIVNRLSHLTCRYGFRPDDAFLQTTAFVFDSSVEQLFWPLINGGKTVVPSPMVGYELSKILDTIEREAVTFTDFVSSFFTVLVGYLAEDARMRDKFRTVRQVIIGGEAANPKALHQFKTLFPTVALINNYGPTETSIAVLEYEVPSHLIDPVPIGKPIGNAHAFILDSDLNPLPPGVPGDLYIGGVCVGLGYVNDDEKTRSVFRSSPLPEFSGEPIYKTGDKASYLPDGNIEFFGRDDQQVKLHGVRVELRDVETVLGKHPSIRAVVVMARDDVAGDKRLVAYFTACDGPAPAAAELRTFLAKTLPQAFIPSAFVVLDAFPLTQNGKIDRRALPAPPTGGHDVSDDDRPTTPMELIVGDAWKKLLGVREVSCTDNFYDLGGSSLLAAQVIAAVEASTGVRIEAQEMFFQTLGQLASFCDSRSATATAVEHKAPGLFQRLADGARRLVGSGGRA